MSYDPQPGFDGIDWIMCALVLALTFAAELAFDPPVQRAEPVIEQPTTDEAAP